MRETGNPYELTIENDLAAQRRGLAEAAWYTSPVERSTLLGLLQRDDWPAIRDTAVWFGIIAVSGILGFLAWGSWWAVIPFAIYGVVYGSTSDSRWHESSHGTAFRTDWMNNALYEIASFMVFRESIPWRWSHTRHHTDTIIVGRDPEIAVPRPANITTFLLGFVGIPAILPELRRMSLHAIGRITEVERRYIPESEFPRIFIRARIYLVIYGTVIASSTVVHSWLPLMYIGLPAIYGGWLMRVYGHTQHTGLAENVTDHRLNTRTVKMNWLNRFLYWNMNFHIEHHMYPMVPYHALPKLHEEIKDDCPAPYPTLLSAWKEIVLAVYRQAQDPDFFVRRTTPEQKQRSEPSVNLVVSDFTPDTDGWIRVCPIDALQAQDVCRFDYRDRSIAIYRLADSRFFATDGYCTHGNAHLANGLIIGTEIECPKHNGRFDICTGKASRTPACVPLQTHETRVTDNWLLLRINADATDLREFSVVSNRNVTPYIKELVLAPAANSAKFDYTPGDYIQLAIPPYSGLSVSPNDISEEFRSTWSRELLDAAQSSNQATVKRNYSMGSNPARDRSLVFNIRFTPSPTGYNCDAGIGSTYVFKLKPGDKVSLTGPFGTFHVADTDREMIYVGGGSGMAPLRSHLSYLLETIYSDRKISFWYGARSKRDLFYADYFETLAEKYPNFDFHVAYSEEDAGDRNHSGFIHDVLWRRYLSTHTSPEELEYYLCGPPPMIRAMLSLLQDLSVPVDQIRYDEF